MSDKIYELLTTNQTDRTHDEILEELEEEHAGRETLTEVPYYRMDGKEHSDMKGDIDLLIPGDDITVIYEVKSDATYGNMKRAQEQLDRIAETFGDQSEYLDYRMRLGDQDIDYTPYMEEDG